MSHTQRFTRPLSHAQGLVRIHHTLTAKGSPGLSSTFHVAKALPKEEAYIPTSTLFYSDSYVLSLPGPQEERDEPPNCPLSPSAFVLSLRWVSVWRDDDRTQLPSWLRLCSHHSAKHPSRQIKFTQNLFSQPHGTLSAVIFLRILHLLKGSATGHGESGATARLKICAQEKMINTTKALSIPKASAPGPVMGEERRSLWVEATSAQKNQLC